MAHQPSVTPWDPIRGPNQLPQDSQIFLSGYSDNRPLDSKFAALNEFDQNFHFSNDVVENAMQMVTDFAESHTKNKVQRKFLIAL